MAAAISIDVVSSTAQASIGDGAHVDATGLLTLDAENNVDASATADGRAVTSTDGTGIGAAVALNVATAKALAQIGDADVKATGVTLTAGMTEVQGDNAQDKTHNFLADATAGAGGGKTGVAGSFALNVIDASSDAIIASGAAVDATSGDVKLDAKSAVSSVANAKPADDVTGGTNIGVGASVALSIVTAGAHAQLADGSALTHAKDLTLTADSSHEVTTFAKNGAKGQTAITPVIAIAVVNDDALTSIGTGGALTIGGALKADATETGKTVTTAEGNTTPGKTGVGISLALTVADDSATSNTQRDIAAGGAVSFGAHAAGSSDSEAKASVAGDKGEEGAGGDGSDPGVDNKVTKELGFADGKAKEKDPAAKGTGGKTSPSAETSSDTGGSGGNKISVAGAVAINIGSSSADAAIGDNVTISAGDKLTVSATNNGDAKAVADGSAVVAGSNDAGTSVGAAVAINVANVTTNATIGDNAQVTAKGVTVEAKMRELTSGESSDKTDTLSAEATSGAGGGKTGVAGSFALNVASVSSNATIATGASVSAGAGDLELTAEADSTDTAKALPSKDGASGGKVGIGASVALNIVQQQAHAEVADGGTVSSAHDAKLGATSSHVATTQAKAGSKGDTAVTPSIAISVVNDEAIAQLGTGSVMTLSGALDAEATETGKTDTTAEGDTTSGKTGVGVSLALTVANDTATATTKRDITTSTGAVTFGAHAAGSSSSTAKASVAGDKGEDGAGGSGSDAGVDKKVTNNLDFADKKSKEKDSTKKGTGGATSPSAETSDSTGGSGGNKISVAGAVGIDIGSSTADASVGSGVTISAGDKLTLSATNNGDSKAVADGTAVVAGSPTSGTGVGAAVAINVANVTTHATIGEGAHVTAKGVAVEAGMRELGSGDSSTRPTRSTPRRARARAAARPAWPARSR